MHAAIAFCHTMKQRKATELPGLFSTSQLIHQRPLFAEDRGVHDSSEQKFFYDKVFEIFEHKSTAIATATGRRG